ncbi:glycosyltransferase family 2 protein [Candidatus Reidiella endopervernicosa]|nr:glycosyltransferase family A protein [Candidatus Reidiella endopervernicosa]QKQ25500.1 glycosyltransferase family 2 protein [Candidatus Reidiella endopervernicosa]
MHTTDIIITCMGRLEHLQQSLPLAITQQNSHCIVVDYSCPENSGDWVENNHPDVTVVRVPGQNQFNLSAARNAAIDHATGEWLLFIDADALLAPKFISTIFSRITTESALRTDPVNADKEKMGTFLIKRKLFDKIGGYDDVMQGWGYEDIDLYLRMERAGHLLYIMSDELIDTITHSDKIRTDNYKWKDVNLSRGINRYYARIKLDIETLLRKALPKQERSNLYKALIDNISKTIEFGKPSRIEIALDAETYRDIKRNRTLIYQFSREEISTLLAAEQ